MNTMRISTTLEFCSTVLSKIGSAIQSVKLTLLAAMCYIQHTDHSPKPLPTIPTDSTFRGALMMHITRCKIFCKNHITTWVSYLTGTMALLIVSLILFTGVGEHWNRAGARYRDHVAEAKYHVVKVQ
jgi:hypothetical protein